MSPNFAVGSATREWVALRKSAVTWFTPGCVFLPARLFFQNCVALHHRSERARASPVAICCGQGALGPFQPPPLHGLLRWSPERSRSDALRMAQAAGG